MSAVVQVETSGVANVPGSNVEDAWAAAARAEGRSPFMGLGYEELLAEAAKLAPEHTQQASEIIEAVSVLELSEVQREAIAKRIVESTRISIRTVKTDMKNATRAWAEKQAPTPEELAARKALEAARIEAERQAECALVSKRVEPLARDPKLMERMIAFVHSQGIVGEEAAIIAILLTFASRRLRRRALSYLRRGAPSSGKNVVIETMLTMMPPEAVFTASGGSPRSLPYHGGADNRASLQHRVIYIPEAASIAERNGVENDNTLMLRTLISEGRLHYHTVTTRADGPPESVEIVKDGPIALVITSARDNIEQELLTRLLTADTDESQAQTRRVMASMATAATGTKANTKADTTLAEWQDFQRMLELSGPYDVVVPFAEAIAAGYSGLKSLLRVRRDIGNLLTAVSASAVIHMHQRQRDAEGRIVAELVDYEWAFRAFSVGLAALYKPQFSPGIIALVKALEAEIGKRKAEVRQQLADYKKKGQVPPPDLVERDYVRISNRQLLDRLGIASSDTVTSRVKAALAAELIQIVDSNSVRSSALQYRVKVPSLVLAAQLPGGAGMPEPSIVEALARDPEALAAMLATGDAEEEAARVAEQAAAVAGVTEDDDEI